MNELPKELTSDLLGLVLDEKVIKIEPRKAHNNIYYTIEFDEDELDLDKSIDTLTRLMKEWCWEQDYWLASGRDTETFWFAELENSEKDEWCPRRVEQSEFEAVLKATEWVAKEKGLLSA